MVSREGWIAAACLLHDCHDDIRNSYRSARISRHFFVGWREKEFARVS